MRHCETLQFVGRCYCTVPAIAMSQLHDTATLEGQPESARINGQVRR